MAGNQTVTVLEADGTTSTDVEVLGMGRQAATASKSTNFSNEDKTVIDAIAASLVTIDGRVDGLEALIASTNTKLDTAITALQIIDNPTLGAGAADANTTRVTVDTGQLGTLGQTTMSASAPVTLPTNQSWPTGMSPRAFSVAFAVLTRPNNTTAYTAADSISNHATAGSVTPLVSGNISDVNDDPLTITDIIVSSTDTGLAGKKLRAYVFNADPTASSGVGAGDNAAYSQKVAGYVGSFMGYMETGFSDGTVGRLVPSFNETNYSQAGGFVVTKPASGAKTLWIQYQAVEAFTPSASSSTITGTARGFQGRAS